VSDTIGIELAAFDLGGVMIDVVESIPIATFAGLSGKTCEEVFGQIFSPERKRPIETGAITPGAHANRASQALGLSLDTREFWQVHCTSHRENRAVGEIVAAVAQQAQVTIASNLPSPHWDWVQEHLPYARLFKPPILSFEIGVMKPDPEYYRQLICRSGFPPNRIFFTDDRPENVEAARAEGIEAFLFNGAAGLRADLVRCGVRI
jgi:FMN phosphatase YigB (HAD superfamily)